MRSFTERLVAGLEVDEETVAVHLERSLMLVTALAPRIGCERAAELAMRALHEDKTLREVLLDEGTLTADEFDDLVSRAAARPTRA